MAWKKINITYFNIEDQKFLFDTLKKRFFIQFVVDLDKERYAQH